ncbi:sensor histidine kinase [Paenibacillus eucommiae]|uniref:Oxygen sensor histidine kinase NreB n=1 Tax=Paenibacillus eucommiae TaxID=1355755 RepID=A0ABS4J820_9BACL|nr:sensor histidine kinase [Paenibacillus eucommiae]MBP1995994.1 two-component system sensor histidine kinase DesK [Paenibacillus eucommiae]
MQKLYSIFPKSTGLAPYIWVVFCILPFYFIFRSSSTNEIIFGIILIIIFFICYRLSFTAKGWPVYVWTSIQIVISIIMTSLFGYVYFSFFLAFFIGNIQNRIGFFTLYSVHLLSTFITINFGLALQTKWFLAQFPFILISLIGVILLPFNAYYRNKRGELQEQLEDANKRISEFIKQEERQRIARDLHDTLGQKLSLIGLKSDLAGKLIYKNPERAQSEMKDVHQTARTALKEVREMVSHMRGTRVEEEIIRIKQILKAAQIEVEFVGLARLTNVSLFIENVLSMCMKEVITNVVKHSQATSCQISIEQSKTDIKISVQDNGVGITKEGYTVKGNGLLGIKERVEFVNGSLDINSDGQAGTTVTIKVPNLVKQTGRGR